MTHTDKLKELAAILKADYLNETEAIERLALAFSQGNAEEDESFSVSCDLQLLGPANDWNGIRSAADRVRTEWETRIMNPALLLHHSRRNNR